MAKAHTTPWEGGWSGSCTELMTAVNTMVSETARTTDWPASPEGTRHRLNRALPLLERLGVQGEFRRAPTATADRLVTLTLDAARRW